MDARTALRNIAQRYLQQRQENSPAPTPDQTGVVALNTTTKEVEL
jgi:hypothetical protein